MTNHVRLREIITDVEDLYSTGITRGLYCGFETLHEYYSLKEGGTTYLYGSPFSGKTEVWFEVMMNLTELYGHRHAIYSPESGTASEIFAELISKRLRKPFYKNYQNHITEDELMKEKDFVDEYFYIIDPKDSDLSVEDFYDEVLMIEKKHKVKINTTCCDPFNELRHDFAKDNGRQDLYIENRLGFIRRDAKKYGRHNTIITHVADQEPVRMKDGSLYYPPATPRQIAGGQAWYRKGMNMISVWRPTAGMIDKETGQPYEENEVHLIIQKYKPKGVGKRGTAQLYFNIHQNRYYEKINGTPRYAGAQLTQPVPQYSQTKITPNKELELEKDNFPF